MHLRWNSIHAQVVRDVFSPNGLWNIPSREQSALPTLWNKQYIGLQDFGRWVTVRIKTYGFFLKIIPTPNSPYEL